MRSLMMSLLLAAACSSSAPAPAPAPAPASTRAVPAAPMKSTTAEVELRGTYSLPKSARGDVRVYVTDGPCWKPETRALADVRGSEGRFFAEVIVKQGMLLWVCAAAVPPSGPVTVSAALARAPLKGEGEGEVLFNDLALALAAGPAVTPPPPRATPATK